MIYRNLVTCKGLSAVLFEPHLRQVTCLVVRPRLNSTILKQYSSLYNPSKLNPSVLFHEHAINYVLKMGRWLSNDTLQSKRLPEWPCPEVILNALLISFPFNTHGSQCKLLIKLSQLTVPALLLTPTRLCLGTTYWIPSGRLRKNF